MAPANLEECIVELCKLIKPDEVDQIKRIDEDKFLAVMHHDLGRTIRNEWGLWQEDSPLKTYFENLGLWHPDDMSGIILCCFHRHLSGKSFDVKGQVVFYKEYWKKNEHP